MVISTSRSLSFPFTSTDAIVFPSNFIRLLFTSLCSVPIGISGVFLLNCDFDIKVTGEPLSILNLIDRLLTNEVRVTTSVPFFYSWRVEWTIWFTEWIVFGDQSSSYALLVSSSCTWFTLLFVLQHFAWCPIFSQFAHFFSLAEILVVWTSWVLRICYSLVF